MRRAALPLSVAALAILGAGPCIAAITVIPVRGDVRALALAGDSVVVARQPAGRGIIVERLTSGSAPQVVLRTALDAESDQIALAASPQALAVSLQVGGIERLAASRVLVGPLTGPLREVASCRAGLIGAAIDVAGSRIAWREGGCGEPADIARSVGPSAIVTGGADPGAPLRRTEIEPQALAASVVLSAEGDLVGLLRPSFFTVDSEVRRLGAAGLGQRIAAESGRYVGPVGVLADGTAIIAVTSLDADGTNPPASGRCASTLFALSAGSSDQRPLSLGGCLSEGEIPVLPFTADTAGDRAIALSTQPRPSGEADRPQSVAVVSVRADGSDRRVVARGSYRPPLGVAAEPDRVAWWQPRCTGGMEIVVQSGAPATGSPAIASCAVEVTTRRTRVRDGRIAVRLRCPLGCLGLAFDAGQRLPRPLRQFEFGRGTHRLSLALTRRTRRSGRLRLRLVVSGGPSRSAVIGLRR